MQNGREGPQLFTMPVAAWDSAILVGGATLTLTGMSRLPPSNCFRGLALRNEVIGLISDPERQRSCCFGIVTKNRDGMTCLMHE